MRLFWVCLWPAVLPALGGEAKVPPAPVALYAEFQQPPPRAVLSALQDELAIIMGPVGYRFEWRSLAAVRGNEVSAELAVVKFKGRCDVANLDTHAPMPGALGWTHVSDGVVLPFSDVDCGRIRAFIQMGLLGFPAKAREEVFGRAVGRVLAHELYHIFAKTAHHGTNGVAKASYSVHDLLSDDFAFEEQESTALRDQPRSVAANKASLH